MPYISGPCNGDTEGTLRWNFDDKQLEVQQQFNYYVGILSHTWTSQACDGSKWQSVGSGGGKLGNSKDKPASGCRHALESGATVSGLYWLKPSGVSKPFQVSL